MDRLKVIIDTPEAYAPEGPPVFDREIGPEAIQSAINKSKFNDQILETEEGILGIKFNESPDAFTKAHNELIDNFQAKLEAMAESAIPRTIDAAARELSGDNEQEYQKYKQTFEDRIKHLRFIRTQDHYVSSMLGNVRHISGSLYINSVFGLIEGQQGADIVEHMVLPHEILHELLTHAKTEAAIALEFLTIGLPSRNGILTISNPEDKPVESVAQTQTFASWLNEAFIEDFRSKIIGTEEVGYFRGVAILRTLKAMDPGLEEHLRRVAFTSEAPAVLIGRIESTIGPLGVEKVEELLEQSWNSDQRKIIYKYDGEDFINELTGLLDVSNKDQFCELLTKQLSEMKKLPVPPNLVSKH